MSDEIMQRVQSRAMDDMENIKDSIQCGTKHIVQTGPAGRKNVYEKLRILSDAAKYDVACTSSGVDRKGDGTGMRKLQQRRDLPQFFR